MKPTATKQGIGSCGIGVDGCSIIGKPNKAANSKPVYCPALGLD